MVGSWKYHYGVNMSVIEYVSFFFFVLFCFLVGQNNHSIIFPLQFSTEILLFRPLQSIGDWMNA